MDNLYVHRSTITLILLFSFSIALIHKAQKTLYPNLYSNIFEVTRLKNIYEKFHSKTEQNYDLIIVGSGLAGLTSAFQANILDKNLKILILEYNSKFGGNSAKATSGINMLETEIQSKNNIKDAFNIFYNDTTIAGKRLGDPNIIETAVKDSHDLYDFFKEKAKTNLTLVGLLGGHSVPRTHRPEKGTIGYYLVSTLYNILKNIKNVQFSFNSELTDIITDKNNIKVEGVVYKKNGATVTAKTKALILCTGGFSYDFSIDSLLEEFAPDIMKFPTTNGNHTQGKGLKIARKKGIALTGMEHVQIHPTGFVDTAERFNKNKMLCPELIRGVGAIIINQKGKRFCNELGTRDYVTKKIIENCDKKNNDTIDQYEAILLLNNEGIKNFGKNAEFYMKKRLIKTFKNFKDMCEVMDIDNYYEDLVKEIEKYNQNIDGKADEFGKKVFPIKFNVSDYVYASFITPSIHYTMGGLKMNRDTELIKNDGSIMKGLYGAGEVTGGLHGGNRLGGNSLMECGVFGRRAAKSAVKYIKNL